ncbi:hypothetical protein GALL_327150 [mine drainage metagenome]|uniref:Uncharacterized protein n=1 Tax=mine drainage metagenome TaxID=410659 RepID=A0A1J5QQ07_9ZZZZ
MQHGRQRHDQPAGGAGIECRQIAHLDDFLAPHYLAQRKLQLVFDRAIQIGLEKQPRARGGAQAKGRDQIAAAGAQAEQPGHEVADARIMRRNETLPDELFDLVAFRGRVLTDIEHLGQTGIECRRIDAACAIGRCFGIQQGGCCDHGVPVRHN